MTARYKAANCSRNREFAPSVIDGPMDWIVPYGVWLPSRYRHCWSGHGKNQVQTNGYFHVTSQTTNQHWANRRAMVRVTVCTATYKGTHVIQACPYNFLILRGFRRFTDERCK